MYVFKHHTQLIVIGCLAFKDSALWEKQTVSSCVRAFPAAEMAAPFVPSVGVTDILHIRLFLSTQPGHAISDDCHVVFHQDIVNPYG